MHGDRMISKFVGEGLFHVEQHGKQTRFIVAQAIEDFRDVGGIRYGAVKVRREPGDVPLRGTTSHPD